MQKKWTLLGILLCGGLRVMALPVSEATARLVATHFLAAKMDGADKVDLGKTEVYRSLQAGSTGAQAIYLFNNTATDGFVLVAADDVVQPILGYSASDRFEKDAAGPEARYWVGQYADQIDWMVRHNLPATTAVQLQWQQWYQAIRPLARPTSTVTPMLTTQWNQGQYYNLFTPANGPEHTPVGCVATAMAQIMKYWNAPTTGTGSYSYTHKEYGVLSADFSATTYSWGMMPNRLTKGSSDMAKESVSLLGYHCAVSVKMDFAQTGSGSYVIAEGMPQRNAENAFKNHFNYKKSIEGLVRKDYTEEQWINLLKKEMDEGRPVLYAGYGQAGGHAFVFDGYDEQDRFHINWGWGGMSDGYFVVNDLSPSALGIGGGGGNFNSNQQALIKIEPLMPGDTLSLVSNAALNLDATTIYVGDSLSLTTIIRNRGTLDFLGNWTAAIYRQDSLVVSYVQTLANQLLPKSTDTTIVFSNKGIVSLKAGSYFIKVLYRQEGETLWEALPDDNGFTNRIDLLVEEKPSGIVPVTTRQELKVYPNPAQKEVHLQWEGESSMEQIHVFNVLGRRVGAYPGNNSHLVTLPLNGLSPGIYTIEVMTSQGKIMRTLVLQP